MAVGKSTLVKKLKTTHLSIYEDSMKNSLLPHWYGGSFTPYFWESLCVRMYLEKETTAILNAIKEEAILGIVFDRSTIDCFNFAVSLYILYYHTCKKHHPTMMTTIQEIFAMIEANRKFWVNLNQYEMVYCEMSNRYSWRNLFTRNRPSERYVEHINWNPSYIFKSPGDYDLFCNMYAYSSMLLAHFLQKYFTDSIFAIVSPISTIKKQEFLYYRTSENPKMDLLRSEMHYSKNASFKMNSTLPAMVNISQFIMQTCSPDVLNNIIPFHLNDIFKDGIYIEQENIVDWLHQKCTFL